MMKVYAVFYKEDNTFETITNDFEKWFKEQNLERKASGEETPYFKNDFKVYEGDIE